MAMSYAKRGSQVAPLVDWVETPIAHVFYLNVPGCRVEDIDVQLECNDKDLQISGVFKTPNEVELCAGGAKCHLSERPRGTFFRQFKLPPDSVVSLENIKACEEDGVLTITLPKKPSLYKIPILA